MDLAEENARLRERVAELEGALIKQQRVVLKRENLSEKVIASYWAKIDRSGGEDACWNRTTKSDRFHVTKRQAIAFRRFGWLLAFGETWPSEIIITCHNELCLNPRHFARTDADKFWSYVTKGEGDACWIWQGGLVKKGEVGAERAYGAFAPRTDEITPAHRYSYELANGKIEGHVHHDAERELCVLHRCDNPRCVRPDHLFLGTDADNIKDMISKGRAGWQRARANMQRLAEGAMHRTESQTGGTP